MNKTVNEEFIAAQALALKPAISVAIDRNVGCHFKIGVALNGLREQLLLSRDQERTPLAEAIPPIEIEGG